MVIMHHPEKDCEKKSADYLWEFLPKEKSLFTNGKDRGVAIGNLFAQLFANFLLSKLDWRVDYYCEHHVRYVDDMVLVARRKETLLRLMPTIRETLTSLGLRLNEKKFYFQHYSKGVEFIGSIVKPGRVYTCNRTITNFVAAVRRLNEANDERQVLHAVCSINSYLGLLRHTNEYATRRKVLNMIEPHVFKEYVYIKGHYEVLAVKNKHNVMYQTRQRIRNGDYG